MTCGDALSDAEGCTRSDAPTRKREYGPIQTDNQLNAIRYYDRLLLHERTSSSSCRAMIASGALTVSCRLCLDTLLT
jgi:hypothetical protein